MVQEVKINFSDFSTTIANLKKKSLFKLDNGEFEHGIV